MYVTSQMGTALTGDPRDVALRNALDSDVASRVEEPSIEQKMPNEPRLAHQSS
jgi:hypothetical protein